MKLTDHRLQLTVLILLFLPLFGWGCQEKAGSLVLPQSEQDTVASVDTTPSSDTVKSTDTSALDTAKPKDIVIEDADGIKGNQKDTSPDIKVPEGWKVYKDSLMMFNYPDGFFAKQIVKDEQVAIVGIFASTAKCNVGDPHCGPDIKVELIANLTDAPLNTFVNDAGGTAHLFQDAIEGYEDITVQGFKAMEFKQVIGASTSMLVVVIPQSGRVWKISLDADSTISNNTFYQVIASLLNQVGGVS